MVKKKGKSAKSARKGGESWQAEDVPVHTGLPPQVEGQLRCFCRLSINQVLWLVPHPPDVTHVRVKWWGEDGDGSLFRPADIKKGEGGPSKTTARYPVRSGPKQFASYLNDMGGLPLEILSGAMLIPVGQAEVTQIGLLSPSRPINGFFPIISPTEEKIGEIQASLVLESLMASYDSMGSIPTTDLSMETHSSHATHESMYPQKSTPLPSAQHPRKPVEDPFISPASHQATGNRMLNGYAEDLKQTLNYDLRHDPARRQYQPVEMGSTVAITTNGDVVKTNINSVNERIGGHYSASSDHQPPTSLPAPSSNGDLLSVLLDRGNKLREQMIVSTVNSDKKQSIESHHNLPEATKPDDVQATLPSHMGQNLSMMSVGSSNGSFLKEILRAEKAARGETERMNLDEKAVDLVFGGDMLDDIRMLKNLHGSPGSSISSADDLTSEPGDPIHNESILNELFYKNLASEASGMSDLSGDEGMAKSRTNTSAVSVEDADNMRPSSRRSSVSSLSMAFPADRKPRKEKKQKTVAKSIAKTVKRKSRVPSKRKGSKKRRSSKSRSRTSGSELSDCDNMSTASTPRSESSRVSFDMVPSDVEEQPVRESSKSSRKVANDGLSVERLTLLGRVHVARVTIENLLLIGQDLDTSTGKKKGKLKSGTKPPRPSPKAKKSSTYFIEYQFPVVATSRDKYSPNAMATEVMRVVSRNVKNNTVTFSHRSVFPVMFDGTSIERWWKSALVFKVFSRTAGQKVPTLIGSCGVPLKSILKSDSFHVNRSMDVRESCKNISLSSSLRSNREEGLIGSLKVVIELASDHREFPTALAKTKLAEMTGKAKIVPIPQALPPAPKPPLPVPVQDINRRSRSPSPSFPRGLESHQTQTEVRSTNISEMPGPNPMPQPPAVSINQYNANQQMSDLQGINQNMTQNGPECLTLHTMLLIPEGQNISMQGVPNLHLARRHPIFPPQPTSQSAPGVKARDVSVRNTYLVCRMFWCNDAVHSNVCWGTVQPHFNFTQIAPVLVSESLLERMRNNFMVVEVWDKKTSAEHDKLVGMVKLSLHQFYMSFRDKKISAALLKSQYPVISVDNYLPVVDPFSGSQYGQLKVLLAMGSAEQVATLQRMKVDGVVTTVPERPQHYLERQDVFTNETQPNQIGTESVVEHIFEIVIEGIRGLNLFENMIWGEADCFVQYHFPAQVQTQPTGAPVIKHAVPTMKAFRTATTLCIPDPTFNDITRHRVLLPPGTPVQRELLTACAGSSGSGGVPFEVWCRYYHPNVRDQCIAKASLPLAKLCAMITMQKRGEPSVQTFSLPLTQVPLNSEVMDTEAKAKSPESGLMDLTIHYKTQTTQMESSSAATKNLAGAQVCISVGVIKACGLKTAAEASAQHDSGMQYPAEVGVNAYVRCRLSFLGKMGERITRTIARSFTPDFSHYMDFPCPLLWTEADNDCMSLAEILETAEATFEVWHQVPGMSSDFDHQLQSLGGEDVSGRKIVSKTSDVLLGSTTIPLVGLLTNRTGYCGWYPVHIPSKGWEREQGADREPILSESHGQKGLDRVGGGLELSVKFAHHDNRERVIHAARGVGWSPVDLDIEQDDWESEDESSGRYHHVTVSLDHISFPLQNALIAGQNTLDKTARCYLRYKFYDKAAVMSRFVPVGINSSGYIVCQPKHKHQLQIADSSTYKWYLREEKLEVQVWVSYGSRREEEQRPKHRDKLIGSSYISLESLSDQRRKQHRVSGMYPLFKPGASSLGGAYIRAHVTSKPQFGHMDLGEQDGVINIPEDEMDADYDPDDSFHQLMAQKKPASRSASPKKELEKEEVRVANFAVHVAVERALHLPHITEHSRSEESLPNSYVSFPTAESTIQTYTNVFYNSDNPVWDFELETQLSTELLYEENKNLVLKVWHKPAGAPKDPDKLTDRVLGFVSVDLTPLTSGLHSVCGWYNIMDFNGQCKGQIKISVIPQESVTAYGPDGTPATVQPPAGTHTSFLSLPTWFPVTSAPSSNIPSFPSLNLPHFQEHYHSVKNHHMQLQHQLQSHIQQFLQRQEQSQQENPQESGPDSQPSGVPVSQPSVHQIPSSQPSIHWHPSFPEPRYEEQPASRSILFSSLRRNLQDLDEITNKLKGRLTTVPHLHEIPQSEFEIPVTSQSVPFPLTSTQSTISSVDISRSRHATPTPRDDLMHTGSHGGESARTAIDSGAYSAEHSTEKDENEPLDSQRSCSDKLDTFRLGTTPRDFVGQAESDSGYHFDCTPRENLTLTNNEELAFNVGLTLTPREDEYSESGGFNYLSSARETNGHTGFTPRDISRSGNSNNNRTSENLHSDGKVDQAESLAHLGDDVKQMSIIQEFPENDAPGSDEDDEGENKFYHRYRDMLDEEEKENDKSDNSDDEDDEGDIVVPRTLNDISGRFSVHGEVTPVVQSGDSFDQPYRGKLSYTKRSKFKNSHTVPNEKLLDENSDSESDSEIVQRLQQPQQSTHEDRLAYMEKDSWLSDSDKEIEENEIIVGHSRFDSESSQGAKHKYSRLDSDTGYSSRENVSEGYQVPVRTQNQSGSHATQSKSHDLGVEVIDLEGEDGVFSDKPKRHLLSNVELESTSGSWGIRMESGINSRGSSAGSRFTQRTYSEHSSESVGVILEEPETQRSLKSEKEPHSARTEELEDFFDGPEQCQGRPRSNTMSSSDSEHNVPPQARQSSETQGSSQTRTTGMSNAVIVNGDIGDEESEEETDPKYLVQHGRQDRGDNLPNFFMPVKHLEESMKTLQLVTGKVNKEREDSRAEAASEMASKLTGEEYKNKFGQTATAKNRQLPTAEETKRIAKIFSAKFH